jgi:hypothetical protein
LFCGGLAAARDRGRRLHHHRFHLQDLLALTVLGNGNLGGTTQ